MALQLTKRQSDILQFVIESIRECGWPPTIAEIGRQFGISSTNGVNDHLVALEKKGYIVRSSQARGIRVTEKAQTTLYRSAPDSLPLVGQVAAGQPILAAENIEDHIPVVPALAKPQSYCLRVQGDSMVDEGILDGDIIVVDRDRLPKAGDIVVALVGDEATVKHFHPKGDQVELRPANATMEPMVFPGQEVEVQGVVVGLQRMIA